MASNIKAVKEHMLEYLDDPRRGAGEVHFTQQEVSATVPPSQYSHLPSPISRLPSPVSHPRPPRDRDTSVLPWTLETVLHLMKFNLLDLDTNTQIYSVELNL